jgi:hypothetical protein
MAGAVLDLILLASLYGQVSVSLSTCQDFPRYDGKRYTGAELYTCGTYCQAGWCSSNSYITLGSKDGHPSVYVDGALGLYLTIDNVGRSPKNMTRVPEAWDSSAYYFGKGYHYDYWDGELISDKLNTSDPIWNYTDTAGPPPPGLEEACKKVSKILGRPTYIVDDGWKFCKDFPEHLKDKSRNITYPDGTVINPYFWWSSGCMTSRHPDGSYNTYYWTCKVSDNNTMLWDANNFGADPTDTTNTNLITWGFNLPWDVACCCCGGGTKANKPGGQIMFKIEREFPDIAAKLTSANLTDLARFLQKDGLYINTTAHPDWMDTLYPNARAMDLHGSLLYTFPNLTYSADYPDPYPYDDQDGRNLSECQDLTLDDFIENYTISYKRRPDIWADWSGYPCRYYSQDSCANGRATESWNTSGWGPFQFYYNGHVKNGIGHGPHNGTNLRAHAGNVCCGCGGGQINGKLVKPTDDFDYDANTLSWAPSSTRPRTFGRHFASAKKTATHGVKRIHDAIYI